MKRHALLWAALCAAHSGGAQAPFDLDTTFRSTITMKNVNSLLVMDDGKVVVSGRIYFPGDPSWDEKAGARLNTDGSRDMTFNTYAQMGGKLTRWNDRIYAQNGNGVRRLMLDGILDSTFISLTLGPYFSTGQGGDYHVYPDGRLLVSGWHSLQDTIRGFTGLHSLVWFSNTGYLDTTRTHRKGNNAIYTIKEQPDGKFLCSGLCTVYEGQPVGRVFRVEADGALDTTFQTDFTSGYAFALTALPDARALASGFLVQDGVNDSLHIVRLLPNGELDPAFNNSIQILGDDDGYLPVLHTLLDDGRIVIHGNFMSVDGEARSGIALLDSSGQLLVDVFAGNGCGTFNDGFIDFHTTDGMVQDPIGNWYIYGSYAGYDDGTTNDPQQRFVSRLHGFNVGVEEVEREKPGSLSVYPNPTTTWLAMNVRLNATPHNALVVVRDVMGRTVWQAPVATMEQQLVWDCRAAEPGSYTVELINNGASVAVAKFMAQR